jgi:hypothetical protein
MRRNQLRQTLYRDGILAQHGFVKSTQIELVFPLTFDLLALTVMRHASDEVRAQLFGALREKHFPPTPTR